MKKYTVTSKMSLEFGHIELTKEQVKDRVNCLEPLKDVPGVYNIIKPIEFKVGEIVGLRPANSDKYIKTHVELVKGCVREMAEVVMTKTKPMQKR